jgi:hypothetical protein
MVSGFSFDSTGITHGEVDKNGMPLTCYYKEAVTKHLECPMLDFCHEVCQI